MAMVVIFAFYKLKVIHPRDLVQIFFRVAEQPSWRKIWPFRAIRLPSSSPQVDRWHNT